jgi:Anaphase-promoting complex subunit 11 RING-H2 finger
VNYWSPFPRVDVNMAEELLERHSLSCSSSSQANGKGLIASRPSLRGHVQKHRVSSRDSLVHPFLCYVHHLLRHSKMKVVIKHWHAVAAWKWDTGNNDDDDDEEGHVCGICRVPYEGCCPACKVPGDDCPLSLYLICSRIQIANGSVV